MINFDEKNKKFICFRYELGESLHGVIDSSYRPKGWEVNIIKIHPRTVVFDGQEQLEFIVFIELYWLGKFEKGEIPPRTTNHETTPEIRGT